MLTVHGVSGETKIQMQGVRNKFDEAASLEFTVVSVPIVDKYASPFTQTSHCPDPTVAMACV